MFHAVHTWRERKEYRRALKANMSWMLVKLPKSMLEKIFALYPGITTSADAAFKQGTDVHEESIRVVATVVSDILLRKLSVKERQDIISFLRTSSQAQDAKPAIDSVVTLWSEVIVTMEKQAYSLVQAGKLESRWRDVLMSEVIGALDGQTAEERSQKRVVRLIDEALLPKPRVL